MVKAPNPTTPFRSRLCTTRRFSELASIPSESESGVSSCIWPKFETGVRIVLRRYSSVVGCPYHTADSVDTSSNVECHHLQHFPSTITPWTIIAKVSEHILTRMATVRAIVVPEVKKATVQDVPIPKLRDEWVLVRVKAIALNPSDWKHIDYGAADAGCRVGCDYAGVVEDVGSQVAKFKKGDRIAGLVHGW